MSLLVRLLLVALAGISLAGARLANQHSGTQPAEAKATLPRLATLLHMASRQ